MTTALDVQPSSSLSPGDIAVAGFNVIVRDWRLLVGWSLFALLALLAGCVVLAFLLFLAIPVLGAERAPAFGVVVLTAGSLGVQVMIVGAVYRRMLRDAAPEFLYLRVGPDEGRLFVVALAVLAIMFAPVALLAIVSPVVPGAVMPVAAIAAVALVAWILARLSLAAPVAFAERRIDLVAAWRLTRGHAWRLLGVLLLVVFLVAMVEVALWVAITLATGAIGGFQDLAQADADAFAQHPARYLLSVVLNLCASPFLLTLAYAPWAAAYRALKA